MIYMYFSFLSHRRLTWGKLKAERNTALRQPFIKMFNYVQYGHVRSNINSDVKIIVTETYCTILFILKTCASNLIISFLCPI